MKVESVSHYVHDYVDNSDHGYVNDSCHGYVDGNIHNTKKYSNLHLLDLQWFILFSAIVWLNCVVGRDLLIQLSIVVSVLKLSFADFCAG